jgi:hypothetical protein
VKQPEKQKEPAKQKKAKDLNVGKTKTPEKIKGGDAPVKSKWVVKESKKL